MSLYSYYGSEPKPKLYCDRESGLNILYAEIKWSETYGKFFE